MQTDLVAVPPNLPLSHLVETILLQRGLKRVPVIDGSGHPLGCVGVEEVKRLPQRSAAPALSAMSLRRLAPNRPSPQAPRQSRPSSKCSAQAAAISSLPRAAG